MGNWSSQQSAALSDLQKWLDDKRPASQIFRIAGYAGTGKTTIAKEIPALLRRGKVHYCAFTGKAASVMAGKGCHGARTIHSLIYRPVEKLGGEVEFVVCEDADISPFDVLAVDEGSMVNNEMLDDMLSFGCRIVSFLDPFQLPPVSGTGVLVTGTPDVMLTEIHRQAAENPIIRLSMRLRDGQWLEQGRYGDSRVCRMDELSVDDIAKADMRLVGRNSTRHQWNSTMRKLLGFDAGHPLRNEQLVCLKNNKDNGLLNGTLWKVDSAAVRPSGKINLRITADDAGFFPQHVETIAHPEPFRGAEIPGDWRDRKAYDEFDFGYAMTVHKAQGSAWPHVVVKNEAGVFRDDALRWIYTAITRASDRVTVVQ